MAIEAPPASDRATEGSGPGGLAREISAQQASLLERLHAELGDRDPRLFAGAAQRLAAEFGSVTATAVSTLWESAGAAEVRADPAPAAPLPAIDEQPRQPASTTHPGLFEPGQMRRRLEQLIEMQRRYEQSFALIVFDVEGPGARPDEEGGGREGALAVVGAALGESVRLVDETFRMDEGTLCVLAPSQDTVGGVRMSERLLGLLAELEAAGGLPIGVVAGVVACPEHGSGAEALLQKADEALWRARSVGQPVGVGKLDRALGPVG